MTLIAVYKEREAPILLGDFLITGRDRAGLRKKIHRLRPNLVIAWTGHLIAAERVLNTLNEELEAGKISLKRLEEILKVFQPNELHGLSLQLIGWLYDDDFRCFKWDSDRPHQVFYDDVYYSGSGAARFERLNGPGRTSDAGKPDMDPERFALINTCYLMADEVSDFKNRANRFGYCYEILYARDSEFEYVDNILYLFCEVWFDHKGECMGPHLIPKSYSYHNESEFSVVQETLWPEGKLTIYRRLITPAYRIPESEVGELFSQIVSPDYRDPFDVDYICLFASYIKNADSSLAKPLSTQIHVASRTDPMPLVTVNWTAGELTVRFPSKDFFEWIYQIMNKH